VIDPITAPLLLKTLDWLFGEGSKILQERRERRTASQKIGKESPELIVPTPPMDTDIIRSKEVALAHPILATTWSDSEANIKHFLELLDIHTKNYYLAKEQYAKWGSAMVPPIISHNLTEAENEIATTAKQLQTTLGRIYGKKIAVTEVERA
jgi:hypothetical protein